MKNNYDLINGLFAGQQKIPVNAMPINVATEEQAEQPTTKRTFKILNASWDDFLILATLKGKTQAELINGLIEQAVTDSAEEIERYKELVKR